MHCHTITLKTSASSYHAFIPCLSFQNPSSLVHQVLSPIPRSTSTSSVRLRCWSTNISVPRRAPSSNGGTQDWSPLRRGATVKKTTDVATLGNLCVDVVLNVPKLPSPSLHDRKAYMDQLSASPPDEQFWEAGGNCNTAIAAARLGLRCTAIGHVGNEMYGKFLVDVLHDEGIDIVEMNEEADIAYNNPSYETLLCWVLVDPSQRHGFCSRADLKEEPAFSWICKLSDAVKLAIRQSKILFCNGYDFDELSPSVILSTIKYAFEVGTAIFFDPGPRGKSLASGKPEEKRALSEFLTMSDVILLTSDEVESLTGIKDPIQAGQELLRKGVRTKLVIVKMGPNGSIVIAMSSISCVPAFKVNVVDTVGCGDSFVAAVAFGFIHKLPLVNTLLIANAVGAATAMGCGAGRNVADLEKVIKLIRSGNLNYEKEFWDGLVREHSDRLDVTVLSGDTIGCSSNGINRVPMQKVVSELLPKVDSAKRRSRCQEVSS